MFFRPGRRRRVDHKNKHGTDNTREGWHACTLQCEAVMASLAHPEAHAREGNGAKKGNGSVEARLGSAVGAENDTFIASEGDRQQLLIR